MLSSEGKVWSNNAILDFQNTFIYKLMAYSQIHCQLSKSVCTLVLLYLIQSSNFRANFKYRKYSTNYN